jgi:hypothetical protein
MPVHLSRYGHAAMNPDVPAGSPASSEDDEDLKHVNPKFPKAAAGFTLLAGGLGILTGLQILLTVRIFSPFWTVVPYVLLVLGAALVVVARNVFVARPWAAIGGMALGGLLGVASGAWLVFAVMNGFIALYAIWTPVWAALAVGFCAAALSPCLRAERARERLRSQGMSLGL